MADLQALMVTRKTVHKINLDRHKQLYCTVFFTAMERQIEYPRAPM